jgi:CRISPR-associated protein Cas2
MYVLIVYDVSVERVTKVHKLLKQFLHWRQNSVFEGELTESQIETVKSKLNNLINDETDSVLLYISRDEKWLRREHLGQEKNTTDNLL